MPRRRRQTAISLYQEKPFAPASGGDSIENTVLYEFVPPHYDLAQLNQMPDEVGTMRDTIDSLDQNLDRILSEQGISDGARELLKQKWRADLSAAKGEITCMARVAPIGWRELSPAEVHAAIAHGKERPWQNSDGTRNGTNLFEWIFDEYMEWIPGLTQSVLKFADKNLYRDLHIVLSNVRIGILPLPKWFLVSDQNEERLLVPADKDAALIGLTPEQKSALLESRDKSRRAKAGQRTSKRNTPQIRA